MSKPGYAIILFLSASHALRAEKILHAASISCKLIPIPRHISSDCGVCIRVSVENKLQALDELKKEQMVVEQVHEIPEE